MKNTFVYRPSVVSMSVATDVFTWRSIPLFENDFFRRFFFYGTTTQNDLANPFSNVSVAVIAHNEFIPDSPAGGSVTPPPMSSVLIVPPTVFWADEYVGDATPEFTGIWRKEIPTYFRADASSQHLMFLINSAGFGVDGEFIFAADIEHEPPRL